MNTNQFNATRQDRIKEILMNDGGFLSMNQILAALRSRGDECRRSSLNVLLSSMNRQGVLTKTLYDGNCKKPMYRLSGYESEIEEAVRKVELYFSIETPCPLKDEAIASFRMLVNFIKGR